MPNRIADTICIKGKAQQISGFPKQIQVRYRKSKYFHCQQKEVGPESLIFPELTQEYTGKRKPAPCCSKWFCPMRHHPEMNCDVHMMKQKHQSYETIYKVHQPCPSLRITYPGIQLQEVIPNLRMAQCDKKPCCNPDPKKKGHCPM